MHDVDQLLSDLIAMLESSKPNPVLWNSSAARALELQVDHLQNQLRHVQASLIHLPVQL